MIVNGQTRWGTLLLILMFLCLAIFPLQETWPLYSLLLCQEINWRCWLWVTSRWILKLWRSHEKQYSPDMYLDSWNPRLSWQPLCHNMAGPRQRREQGSIVLADKSGCRWSVDGRIFVDNRNHGLKMARGILYAWHRMEIWHRLSNCWNSFDALQWSISSDSNHHYNGQTNMHRLSFQVQPPYL